MFLNENQLAFIESLNAQTARDHRQTMLRLVLVALAACAILPLAFIDWEVLLFIHSTYASEGYSAHAFAAAGLIAALSVARMEARLGTRGKRLVQIATTLAAILFVVGIAAMFAAIAYSQGLGQIGSDLPNIDVVFASAVDAVDNIDLGPDWLETLALDLAKPLFMIAIGCGFILTTTLIAACVGFIGANAAKAYAALVETRHVIAKNHAFRATYEEAIEAAELESQLKNRAEYWSDPARFADLLSGLLHQKLDQRQHTLDTYNSIAPSSIQPVAGIPVASGVMPMDATAEEARLASIKEDIAPERILAALGVPPSTPSLPRS